MRSKPFIIGVTLVTVLVVAGGGLYAYDRAHADELTPGIRVGGVAVGGLTPAAARGPPPRGRPGGQTSSASSSPRGRARSWCIAARAAGRCRPARPGSAPIS